MPPANDHRYGKQGLRDVLPRSVEGSTVALGLMTKYWIPGQVKTRLAATVGPKTAAHLHAAFVGHLCRSLNEYPAEKSVCLTPWERQPDAARFLRDQNANGWSIVPQSEGDLGKRIQAWFANTLVRPVEIAILIGSDCPTLSARQLDQTVALLNRHDLVLGPAVDGGYYLIALKGGWRDRGEAFEKLFQEIAWGSDRVMHETCHRAREIGLTVGKLDQDEDIDTIAELNRLQDKLSSLRSSPSNPLLQQLAIEIQSIMQAPFSVDANPPRSGIERT